MALEPYPYHIPDHLLPALGVRPSVPLPQLPPMMGGWACPGCLRCFSPAVTECPHCQPQDAAPLPVIRINAGPLAAGYTDLFAEAQQSVFGAGSRAAAEEMADGPRRCPPSREGGMCGCGEADDEPRQTCTRARCDC